MIKFKANPTPSKRITSPFGMRKHPVTGKQVGHNGIDFGAINPGKDGDPIFAVDDGVVIISKVNGGGVTKGYGYYIVIQHSWGCSLYGHLKTLSPHKVGARVRGGFTIGIMGNTGTSTATHLHFGITEGDYAKRRWVDPLPYLIGGQKMEVTKAIEILNKKVGLTTETIEYLLNYKFGESLVVKLAMSVGKE